MKMILTSMRIVMIYALFALAWIFFSDRVVAFFTQDVALLSSIQTFKGVVFVLVTALLLFILIRAKINAIEKVQKQLRTNEQQLEYVIQGASLGYWDWDYVNNTHWVNDRWLSFLGLTREDIEDTINDWSDRIHPLDLVITRHAIENTIKHRLPYVVEFRMRHKDGHWVWIEGSGAVVEWDEHTGLPLRLAGTHRDISERKRIQEEVLFLALNDALTSLPNRAALRQELDRLLLTSQPLAFLFLDLDGFKNINDTCGHSVGDKVIQSVGKRFFSCLKESDFLARVGGDEFVVISTEMAQIETLAEALTHSLSSPIGVDKEMFKISVSIGISLSPKDGHTFDMLFKNADIAMYEAKNHGKNRHVFFDASMSESIEKLIELDHDLKEAIDRDEFVVYFQPQIHFDTQSVIGLEALVRWQHTTKGLIAPMAFIPRCEENHLIVPLGELIFQKTLEQMRLWKEAGIYQGVVAINISSVQLEDEHFVEKIESIRQRSGVEASLIELEITESCLMHNPTLSAEMLQKIKTLGYRISIDDFGTGFSSMSYLKQLPLHKLKIDRSFIKDLPHDKDDCAISKAIIALAKTLELEVLAEGVEDVEQQNFLIENGCDSAQGYLWGRPMDVATLEEYLRQN